MSNIERRLKDIQKSLSAQRLTDIAYPVFVANTPRHSGNARNHTVRAPTEIQANYPYAQRLDQGYSPKSPKGMSRPTIDAIRAYVKKTIG